jgi:eukaryotic-like serine/threonine-protein kinase
MAWTPGQMLNGSKYTVEKQLGVGGFAVTYLAKKANNERVVIKTLREELQRRHDFLKLQQDFVNEALKIKGCQHPNIVQVYELFQEENLWCIVLEYIAGENLNQVVLDRGALPEDTAVKYILQIGQALELLHKNNLLHRDIKPENIIIRASKSEAVLIDFGIAREFMPNQPNNHTEYVSDGFAPLEQYSRQLQEGAYTDIYALAATLYVLLTGYQIENLQIVSYLPSSYDRYIAITKSQKDLLLAPKELKENLSDRINQAILKGLELEFQNRPQSVQEWLEILVLPVAPTQPIPAPLPINYLNKSKTLILLSSITAIVAAFSIWWLWIRNEPPYLLEFNFDNEKIDKKQNLVSYNLRENINIKDARVCDKNGIADIKRVSFLLKKDSDIQSNQSLGLGTVEEFRDDDNNSECRLFNYEITAEELKGLTAGNYILIAQAADKNQPPNIKELSDKQFKINAKPTVAYKTSRRIIFNLGDTVRITGINICDENGVSDLVDVAQFQSTPIGTLATESTNEKCKIITYKSTNTLSAGDYQLRLTAADNSDEKTLINTKYFTVNATPEIEFSLDKNSYNLGDKLTLPDIRVCDKNGKNDIQQVTLKWVRLPLSSSQTNTKDLTLQQSSSSNSDCLIYKTALLDLSSSGEFELQITATDKNNRSQEKKTQFTIQGTSLLPTNLF